ncbi:hypothetical protein WCE59_10580 [Luteimonas sp. MJ146]|uniref:DUF6630 family protein n=1 Tax=Luteimonas sp. MJ146 TaxID=3129240 RepID=UPI0031BBB7AB
MHLPDDEFDPDDNFAIGHAPHVDIDEDAATETLVWQFLLLINPGDEETALQQFSTYQEAASHADGEEFEPAWALKDIIDWKSGFQVRAGDTATLIESITELVSRWNLEIDWGVDDPDDDDSLAEASLYSLLQAAYEALRTYGYTLWVWEADADTMAGWITLTQDNEAMRTIAPALGIKLG